MERLEWCARFEKLSSSKCQRGVDSIILYSSTCSVRFHLILNGLRGCEHWVTSNNSRVSHEWVSFLFAIQKDSVELIDFHLFEHVTVPERFINQGEAQKGMNRKMIRLKKSLALFLCTGKSCSSSGCVTKIHPFHLFLVTRCLPVGQYENVGYFGTKLFLIKMNFKLIWILLYCCADNIALF